MASLKRNKYRFDQLSFWIPTSLVVYFLMAVLPMAFHMEEIMPFSAFRLFSKVPSVEEAYSIQITSIGQQKFNPAKSYHELELNNKAWKMEGVFNKFGKAYEAKGLQDEALLYYNHIVSVLPESTRFQLIHLSYKPLERYKENKMTVKVVQTFNSEE